MLLTSWAYRNVEVNSNNDGMSQLNKYFSGGPSLNRTNVVHNANDYIAGGENYLKPLIMVISYKIIVHVQNMPKSG